MSHRRNVLKRTNSKAQNKKEKSRQQKKYLYKESRKI